MKSLLILILGSLASTALGQVTIDNTNEELISYFPQSAWRWQTYDGAENDTVSVTNTSGSICTFEFQATEFDFFSFVGPDSGRATIILDNEVQEVINLFAQEARRFLWTKGNLDNALHNFTIQHSDEDGVALNCDSFVINNATETDDGGGGTDTGAIAGGVVGGVVGLALVALFGWYLWKRQKNKERPEIREIDETSRFPVVESPLVSPFAPSHTVTSMDEDRRESFPGSDFSSQRMSDPAPIYTDTVQQPK